ncbi:Leucine-rich repeat-containing protein 72 [Acropora cervicornis]|uniref:Leucine-rich repeat-containing protein 72 n=1 Tax=Acropora cervicornis TaxID=6130 RepID=A0AAD9Q140_ACRCE|nr:Leucine-rich repeat-containing protein 72 [Acropora cervicornis]
MLTDLNWPSLQSRRRICDLGMFYKIHRGQVNFSIPYELTSVPAYGRTRKSHDFKIRLPFSSVDAYKHSFNVRSIPAWNALPADVVGSASHPEFIRRVSTTLTSYAESKGLEEVPDFRQFKNLQFLWLNKNKLRNLNCFDGNYQLRELYLQDNMIAALNGSLRHLTCLQVLLLNGNQLLKLTDVIHELRAMQSLETLNLFANPLAQDYDYRSYVIHHVPSLQLLDRKEISKAEKSKAKKKYDAERDCMKESLAFGRRGYCSQERVYSPSLSRTDESCHHSQAVVGVP